MKCYKDLDILHIQVTHVIAEIEGKTIENHLRYLASIFEKYLTLIYSIYNTVLDYITFFIPLSKNLS